MKKIILSIFAIGTIALNSFGQAPEGFKYQAVVRDASGIILNNQAVGMQIVIHEGSASGTAVYTETFASTTNAYGLVNLEIGSGTTLDDFSLIDWGNNTFFVETLVDVSGGTTYSSMGTSQMMSVPYALYAKESGSSIPGPQGPAGNDGAPGPQGPAGNDGATGPQGPAGNDGATGPQGPQGIQGPAGNDGATGPQGPQGIQGPAGNDGATGPQGPAGNDGATGPAGPTGIVQIGTIAGYSGAGPFSNMTGYAFVGPTTSLTVTAGQRICGTAEAPLATSSGTATANYGLGYQLNGTGTISNFVGGAYSIVQIGTTRTPLAACGCVSLPAGTYTVGVAIYQSGTVDINSNDYVNGWFMVTN